MSALANSLPKEENDPPNTKYLGILNISAGALIILAFAPWSWYPIAILALALVLPGWLKHPPKRAFKLGYLFGFSYSLGSSYWIYYSLHDYGQAPVFLAALSAVLLAAILSLFFALLATLMSYYRRYHELCIYLLIFPALWIVMEWGRSVLFVGFPWNLLGQALIDTPWRGIFPVFGILSGSALMVICAGSVVYFFKLKSRGKIILTSFLVVFLSATAALQTIEWTQATNDSLKTSVIQANIPQKLKFDKPYFEKLMTQYLNLSARQMNSDLILWPETAIPIYADMFDKQLASMRRQFDEYNIVLMTGIFYRDKEQGKRYNSLMNINDNRFYHKRRLVPFGEYIPMRSLLEVFSKWIIIPMSDLHSANMQPILNVSDYTAGVSICYEVAFASDIVDSLPMADFLINISNDSWFGDSSAPYQMLQMARVRAAESERFMVRATNTGISAIIDHRGRIIEYSDLFEVGTISHDITIRTGSTPYAQWRNIPMLILIVASLLIAYSLNLYSYRNQKNILL